MNNETSIEDEKQLAEASLAEYLSLREELFSIWMQAKSNNQILADTEKALDDAKNEWGDELGLSRGKITESLELRFSKLEDLEKRLRHLKAAMPTTLKALLRKKVEVSRARNSAAAKTGSLQYMLAQEKLKNSIELMLETPEGIEFIGELKRAKADLKSFSNTFLDALSSNKHSSVQPKKCDFFDSFNLPEEHESEEISKKFTESIYALRVLENKMDQLSLEELKNAHLS